MSKKVFTKIVNHLRKQNTKSSNKRGDCLYRGPNGLKCAAGCLIPDELYTKSLEGNNVYDLRFQKIWDVLGYSERTISMVSDMQYIHDMYDVGDWESEFANVAKEYGYAVA